MTYSKHALKPNLVEESLDKLTTEIPNYNLPDLNWLENVYQTGTAVVDVSLIELLEDITKETKDQMFRSDAEFLMAQ